MSPATLDEKFAQTSLATMHWLSGTRTPIPDWEKISENESENWSDVQRHTFWTTVATQWLRRMSEVLGGGYQIRESDEFLVLSQLRDRRAEIFIGFCQSALRRIRRNLGELASNEGSGKYVAIVFTNIDEYYDYISHYYPEGGDYAMSSGMFLQAGYGHFVLCEADLDAMEPVIAHELTHCLLAHLPIPAWLNEGIAVNTEHNFFPYLADPRAALHLPHEMEAMHKAFWNADTIQEFWSGKSFLRTDNGNLLSYDLARRVTDLAARDEVAFKEFVREASMQDAGLSAEHHLGYPLHRLIDVSLGEGDWRPRPVAWNNGVEAGRFSE